MNSSCAIKCLSSCGMMKEKIFTSECSHNFPNGLLLPPLLGVLSICASNGNVSRGRSGKTNDYEYLIKLVHRVRNDYVDSTKAVREFSLR